MLLYAETWIGLLIVVVALAVYRSWLAQHEDDTIHLSEAGSTAVQKQANLAHRLSTIEVAGKVLTVVLILYAVFILAQVIYQGWVESTKIH